MSTVKTLRLLFKCIFYSSRILIDDECVQGKVLAYHYFRQKLHVSSGLL